jgi:hypothetical protein
VAAKGMLGDLNPLGDGPCRSLADDGARVPKILPAAELEGFLTELIVAMPPEHMSHVYNMVHFFDAAVIY